jgi:DNA-binding response OmpR family regulator
MSEILIIEDEKDTAEPVKEALKLNGFDADIAEDGEKGLEMFRQNEYELVLLDLKLPKMSGEEVLRKIREFRPYVYVIVYTCFSEFANIKTLTNIGIDGYVNKGPDADLKELITMVKGKLDPFDKEGLKQLLSNVADK